MFRSKRPGPHALWLFLMVLCASPVAAGIYGVADLEIADVAHHKGYVVVEVTSNSRNARSPFAMAQAYNALQLDAHVSVDALVLQFRQWGIQTQYKRSASGTTLFFEQIDRAPIAFVDSRQVGRSGRYALHLYIEKASSLDAIYARGEQLYAAGKEAKALRCWHFVLAQYGLHRETVYRLANYHFERKNFARAEELYETTIDLDERTWRYPEARIRYALAAENLPGGLQTKHGMCLADYVRYGKGAQTLLAERMLVQVQRPVQMSPITRATSRSWQRKIERSHQVIVHFWSPEDKAAWSTLDGLFAYAVKHRDVLIFVVATEDGNQLRTHERRLTKKFAPFWPDTISRNQAANNVVFLFDEIHLLQNAFFDGDAHTTSQTLFLERGMVAQHVIGAVRWDTIRW